MIVTSEVEADCKLDQLKFIVTKKATERIRS